MRNIAVCNEYGKGCIENAKVAYEWYERAAENGDVFCIFIILKRGMSNFKYESYKQNEKEGRNNKKLSN